MSTKKQVQAEAHARQQKILAFISSKGVTLADDIRSEFGLSKSSMGGIIFQLIYAGKIKRVETGLLDHRHRRIYGYSVVGEVNKIKTVHKESSGFPLADYWPGFPSIAEIVGAKRIVK